MKFALITADSQHKVSYKTSPSRGDATSFMQWVSILDGVHLSFEPLRNEDPSYLKDFDLVMMSGHPQFMVDIIRIGEYLKNSKTITMFYPEGSTQLYDNSINGFHPEYYEAWRACDILSMAEEDKSGYYESFVKGYDTLVCFIHVPITEDMERGSFFRLRGMKKNFSIVYGDNNPNHPIIAFSCIDALRDEYDIRVLGVETRGADINRIFPNLKYSKTEKMDSYPFMELLSESIFHFYPTEWIGTARQPIACAAVGTPCIGSNLSHTQRRLWPKLSFSPYDVENMVNASIRLLRNDDYYDDLCRYAFKELSFYSKKETLKRLESAMVQARKLKASGS